MSVLRVRSSGGKLGKVNAQERALKNYVYNSMFDSLSVPSYEGNDGVEYNIGTQFKVLTNGHITAFKVWKVSIDPGGTFDCYLWDVATQQIIYQTTITFPNNSFRGWITKTLDTPFPVVANKEYIFTNRSFYYSADVGISRGTKDKISAIKGAYDNSPLYPGRTYNPETSYYRDVVFRYEAKPKQPLLLDSYPGANFTFSLRQLKKDYAGASVRVRRSTDNFELSIGFDGDGNLDVNALAAFTGVGSSFLTTNFDTGGFNNSVQSTFSLQPKMATAGVLEKVNNRSSVYFDGNNALEHPVISNNGFSIFVVLVLLSTVSFYGGVFSTGGGKDGMMLLAVTEKDLAWGTFAGVEADYIRDNKPARTILKIGISYLLEMHFSGGNGKFYLNNVFDGNFAATQAQSPHVGGVSAQRPQMQLSEIVFYPFNNEANRQAIAKNIMDYYLIGTDLLDKHIGATIACSLRRVKTYYNGPCIRVRRSSDNTEQDIGFNNTGGLDTVALLAFVGTGHGYISKWYNQSGKSYHFEQSTFSRQPKIVNAGSLVTQNRKPSIYFENSTLISVFHTNEIISSQAEASWFFCFQAPPSTNTLIGTSYSQSILGIYPWSDGNTYYEIGNNVRGQGGIASATSWSNFAIGSFLKTMDNIFVDQNNVNKATSEGKLASFVGANEAVAIGSSPSGNSLLKGHISEIIAYNFHLPNYKDLVTELNNYYQVY